MSEMTDKTDFVETAQQRYKRYGKAKANMDLWSGLLKDAYRYTIPDRDDFFRDTKGDNRMDDIFDDTAIDGVQNYATNIQKMLTPAYRRWAKLIPGDVINKAQKAKNLTDDDIKEVKKQLEEVTETLFRHLENSNFAQKSHESLQDLAVGTGIMILNEGSETDPFYFESVPISQVAVSTGQKGTLENFWRKWNIEVRKVPVKWPRLKMSETMENTLKNNPDEKVELIEGSIRYPLNDEEHQYFYYVQEVKGGVKDLLEEWREYGPFFGFRTAVSPSEQLGRGPVLKVLPSIKVINKLVEFILRGGSLRAFPITLIESNAVIAPSKVNIVPGELITINPTGSGKDPIRPMQVGGDPNFADAFFERLEQKIKKAFGDDPLGAPEQTTGQSATQTDTRQKNWIEKNAAEAARLTAEWLNEVLDRCIRILRKKNIISDLVINGKTIELKIHKKIVAIEFSSPLLAIQDQEDAQKGQVYLQWLGETFGPTGMATVIDIVEYPVWMADKMGVPSKLINDQSVIKEKMFKLQAQAEKAADTEAEGGQQPLPTQQPAPGTPPEMPSSLQGAA